VLEDGLADAGVDVAHADDVGVFSVLAAGQGAEAGAADVPGGVLLQRIHQDLLHALLLTQAEDSGDCSLADRRHLVFCDSFFETLDDDVQNLATDFCFIL
jgi:hypothetical protein